MVWPWVPEGRRLVNEGKCCAGCATDRTGGVRRGGVGARQGKGGSGRSSRSDSPARPAGKAEYAAGERGGGNKSTRTAGGFVRRVAASGGVVIREVSAPPFGTGMAAYQISFFALAPAGATGGTAALDRMGLRFVIAAPGTGALLVEAGTGGAGANGARVARGSPQGRAGQSVTLGPGIVVSTQGDPRQTLRFDVLELDGVPVGLIGAEAPAAGVGLVVTGIEAPGDQPRPLNLAAVGLPVSQGGRPRKSLLSFTHGTRIDTPDGPRPV